MGMVGGGQGAFIGAVHRIAAAIDQKIDLVAGAFSSTPEKSKASGKELLIADDRCYGTFEDMLIAEAALPADQRGGAQGQVQQGGALPQDADRRMPAVVCAVAAHLAGGDGFTSQLGEEHAGEGADVA